jgi:hypothetical protein
MVWYSELTIAGAMIRISKDALPETSQQGALEEEDEEAYEEEATVETFTAEQLSSFDGVTVWCHEAVPDSAEDHYIKGIQEWMSISAAVSSASMCCQ